MGKAVDFSESIKIIQDAHADSVAILEKWRDLLEASGNITFSIKRRDGGTNEITVPTIREAINRYLGGVFEQLILTDAEHEETVIIRLDSDGNVELVNAEDNSANLIVGHIAAGSIVPTGENLPISGNVVLQNAAISEGKVSRLSVTSAQIYGASFHGSVRISGSTTITGEAYIHNANIAVLDAGSVRYRKQVIKWDVEAVTDTQTRGTTAGGLWTGTTEALERAGIFAEPTWCDCLYAPESPGIAGNDLTVYWGATGTVPVTYNGSTNIDVTTMVRWPYKMYEEVSGGYRVRWLPLNEYINRLTYVRTGPVGVSGIYVPVTMTITASGANISSIKKVEAYSCRRFIADVMTGNNSETHILYPM